MNFYRVIAFDTDDWKSNGNWSKTIYYRIGRRPRAIASKVYQTGRTTVLKGVDEINLIQLLLKEIKTRNNVAFMTKLQYF